MAGRRRAVDDGSGRVNLNAAGDPGFTFDVTEADYRAHPNNLWNVNYPSVYVPVMPGIITVQRTAREVSHKNTFYKVIVTAPWVSLAPGLLLVLTVVCCTLIGDALQASLGRRGAPEGRMPLR